jgi:tetratricopeptide (TPR) repeat protein
VQGDHVEGVALVHRALAMAAATTEQEAQACALLALHQLRLGEFEDSIRQALMALAHQIGSGNEPAQSQLHSTLAFAFLSSKLEQQALKHVIKALETARACGDLHAECWALGRASVVHEALGDIPRGMEFGRQSLALARTLGDGEALFASLNNLTSSALVLADKEIAAGRHPLVLLQQALCDVEEALALACKQGNGHREAISRSNFAMVLMRLQRLPEARQAMALCMTQAQTRGYKGLALEIEFDLATLARTEGQGDQALAHWQALLPRVNIKQEA